MFREAAALGEMSGAADLYFSCGNHLYFPGLNSMIV